MLWFAVCAQWIIHFITSEFFTKLVYILTIYVCVCVCPKNEFSKILDVFFLQSSGHKAVKFHWSTYYTHRKNHWLLRRLGCTLCSSDMDRAKSASPTVLKKLSKVDNYSGIWLWNRRPFISYSISTLTATVKMTTRQCQTSCVISLLQHICIAEFAL